MKLILLSLLALAAYSQELSVKITVPNQEPSEMIITGKPVINGLQVLEGFRRSQCVTDAETKVETCKYATVGEAFLAIVAGVISDLSQRFPSAEMVPLIAAKDAAEKAVHEKREALQLEAVAAAKAEEKK